MEVLCAIIVELRDDQIHSNYFHTLAFHPRTVQAGFPAIHLRPTDKRSRNSNH